MMKADDSSATPADMNKVYKGVRKRKWGKWVSEIRLPNSRDRIWLGSYDSPEKAARAFDAALYCLRGRHASFNFPDTPLNLDINVAAACNHSLTHQEIQVIASKFANNEVDPPPQQQEQQEEPSQTTQRAYASGSTSASASASANADVFSFDQLNKAKSDTATTTASSSNSVYQCDTMDWTFLDVLDQHSNAASDYVYSGLHDDNMHAGETMLYSTPPTLLPFQDNINGDHEIEGDEYDFSHQSFLWNWNF